MRYINVYSVKKKHHSTTFKFRIRIVLGSVFIAFTHGVTSVSGHVPAVTMSVWDQRSSAGCRAANAVSSALAGLAAGTHRFPGRAAEPGMTVQAAQEGIPGQLTSSRKHITAGEPGTSQGLGTLSAAAASLAFCQPQIRCLSPTGSSSSNY